MSNPYDELKHYGILGMRWGVRRYQNPDGTLTEAGKRRYRVNDDGELTDKGKKKYDKDVKSQNKADDKIRKKIDDAVAVGDVDRIYALRSKMSSEELKDALTRVKTLNDLYDMTPEQRRKYARRELVKNTAEATANIGKTVKDAIGIYNNTVDVVNTFNGDNKMRKIGEAYVRPDIQNLINLGAWDTLYNMRSKLTPDEIKAFEEKAKTYDSMYNVTTQGKYARDHKWDNKVRPWVREVVSKGDWDNLSKRRSELTDDEVAFAKEYREAYNKIFRGTEDKTNKSSDTKKDRAKEASQNDPRGNVPGSSSDRYRVSSIRRANKRY